MKKYRVKINNLDCANCAMKIEEALQKEKELYNVKVNFNTSTIKYECENEYPLKNIEKIAKSIEPDCTINSSTKKEYKLSILVIATICILISIIFKKLELISTISILISYILLLYRPCKNALKALINNRSINENALITISCIGAYLIGEHFEGIMVVFLYTIGKILEEKAINKSRNSIESLLEIKQDYANLIENGKIKKVDVERVSVGDTLLIKKGEKIPVDGIVTKGRTKLDTSSLTGESAPIEVKKESQVFSSSINLNEVIEIKVTNTFENSMVSKILDLISEATDKKAHTENIVAKMSKYYTPIILILAILTMLILTFFTNIGFEESLYRGLTFLVISCPCAIAISVPLSYFTGIGVCSKKGILIKGSNYLDQLGRMNKIVFDKTGTITNGSFKIDVLDIESDSYKKEEIINILVSGESFSSHPIAKSIMELPHKKIDKKKVTNYEEIEGKGITFDFENKHIKHISIGSNKLCHCKKNADLHLNINGLHIASIKIADGVKTGTKECLEELQKMGIKTYLFTGDKKDITEEITKDLFFNEIHTDMLPQDKYNTYETIHKENEIIAFVGDGINDAPLLKRADVGISMGSIGSDAAIESSDIVIMNDDIKKVNEGIRISKYTTKIIYENLSFALLTKVTILLLSVFGLANMYLAVFADTGVTLLTILNTLRIMKK